MNSGNNKESNKQEKQDHGRVLRHFLIVNLKKKIGLSWHKLIKKSIKALLKFEIVKNFKTENMRRTKIKAVVVLMWSNK